MASTVVYKLDGNLNSCSAKLVKLTCNCNENGIVEDENVPFECTIKSKLPESAYIKIYQCRMTGSYLSSNTCLPILYASVYYERKFVSGYLFSVYINFVVDKQINIDTDVGTDINGKYTLDFTMDNVTDTVNLDSYQGQNDLISKLMVKLGSDSMIETIKSELLKRDNERIARYGKFVAKMPQKPKYNFDEMRKKYEETGEIDI